MEASKELKGGKEEGKESKGKEKRDERKRYVRKLYLNDHKQLYTWPNFSPSSLYI